MSYEGRQDSTFQGTRRSLEEGVFRLGSTRAMFMLLLYDLVFFRVSWATQMGMRGGVAGWLGVGGYDRA